MLRYGKAILVGKADIQHHDIETLRKHEAVELGGGSGALHAKAMRAQRGQQNFPAQFFMVFQYEDMHRLRGGIGSWRPVIQHRHDARR
ncbi:hypothetical protein GCM10027066_16910 [Dyella jejuensis]